MLSENQRKIMITFQQAVTSEGVLDEKTSHLIKLAAAMSVGCAP